MTNGIMLFSSSRTLHITLNAVREHPEHAEGIVLGMIAAVEGYEAMIGEGMREAEERSNVPTEPLPTEPPVKDNRRPAALTRR
jgi:hypothetical protein